MGYFPAVPDPDPDAASAARARQTTLTKPTGSLGRLEELSVWVSACQSQCPPQQFQRARVVVFAGDHGVTAAGVSAYPPEVTAGMMANFVAGGAAAGPDLRDGRVPLAMAAAGPLATHLSGAVVATLTATAGDAPRTRVGATITAGPWGRSERLTPVFQLSGATSLPDPSAPTAVATAAVDTAIAGGAGRFGLRLSVAGVGLQTDSVTVEPEAGAALGWGSERRGELSASVIGRDGAYAGWRLASGVQWSPVGSGVYVALAAGLEGDDAGVLKGWGVLGIGVSGAGNGR
mgnify:CR=1 FL=1